MFVYGSNVVPSGGSKLHFSISSVITLEPTNAKYLVSLTQCQSLLLKSPQI